MEKGKKGTYGRNKVLKVWTDVSWQDRNFTLLVILSIAHNFTITIFFKAFWHPLCIYIALEIPVIMCMTSTNECHILNSLLVCKHNSGFLEQKKLGPPYMGDTQAVPLCSTT